MALEPSTLGSPARDIKLVRVSLLSYGYANGPLVQRQGEAGYRKTMAYNIRHLPNPPRHLRANATGLSRRLQKEFLQHDNVKSFLAKVHGEVIGAIKEGYDQLPSRFEQQVDRERLDEAEQCPLSNTSTCIDTAPQCPDIDITVTIGCEKGQHRSVAFVEELGERLSLLENRDDFPSKGNLDIMIGVTHRDIGAGNDALDLGKSKQSKKEQERSRKEERNAKAGRY